MYCNYKYQIFGSENSNYVDCMVFLMNKQLPTTIKECKKLINQLNIIIASELNIPTNIIDINIATIKNGIIKEVYKGTVDECNNSCYHTFNKHILNKDKKCLITKIIKRDLDLKLLRAVRMLVSSLSRTDNRVIVKKSLKTNFKIQLDVLSKTDFNVYIENNKPNICKEDFYKSISVQMVQSIALYNNIELYDKKDMCLYAPKLKPFINRKDGEYKHIQSYMNTFLKICYKFNHLYNSREILYGQIVNI